MIEPILFLLLGIFLGVLTGLIPGLHPNSVMFLLFPLYALFEELTLLSFIIGLSVTNTLVDFIPSIFIGVPEEDTILSTLPGHKMVLQGLGYYALKLTIFGALFSTLFSLILLILGSSSIPVFYELIRQNMLFVLLFLIILMLFREKRKTRSLLILAFSGILGVLVLNSTLSNTNFILFPLLAGLFATPNLLSSITSSKKIYLRKKEVRVIKTLKGGFLGVIASLLVGFIPGIGSSQSALLIGKILKMNKTDFLVSVGGINTAGLVFSIFALYLIGRTRSGAAVALDNFLNTITFELTFATFSFTLISLGIASIICLLIGKYSLNLLEKLNFRKINIGVLFLLIIGSFLANSFFGLIVFTTSSFLGVLAVRLKVKRSFNMGVLLIPTLMFYLGVGNFFF